MGKDPKGKTPHASKSRQRSKLTLTFCSDLSEVAKFGAIHATSLLRAIQIFPLEDHPLEEVQSFPLTVEETHRDCAPNLDTS